MIPRPGRPCSSPGCGRVAPPGRRGRCTVCAGDRARRRRSHDDQRAYATKAYRDARKDVLARFGWCHMETAPGPCRGALTVHHVDHDPWNNDLANLAPACERHHYTLEREHDAGHLRGPCHHALAVALAVRAAITQLPPDASALTAGKYRYRVKATLSGSGRVVTLAEGECILT